MSEFGDSLNKAKEKYIAAHIKVEIAIQKLGQQGISLPILPPTYYDGTTSKIEALTSLNQENLDSMLNLVGNNNSTSQQLLESNEKLHGIAHGGSK